MRPDNAAGGTETRVVCRLLIAAGGHVAMAGASRQEGAVERQAEDQRE